MGFLPPPRKSHLRQRRFTSRTKAPAIDVTHRQAIPQRFDLL
jgi:hypothetical protein